MFISEPIMSKILDAIEARIEKVLAKYGIKPVSTEPNSVQDVLDSLPRKTIDLDENGMDDSIIKNASAEAFRREQELRARLKDQAKVRIREAE